MSEPGDEEREGKLLRKVEGPRPDRASELALLVGGGVFLLALASIAFVATPHSLSLRGIKLVFEARPMLGAALTVLLAGVAAAAAYLYSAPRCGSAELCERGFWLDDGHTSWIRWDELVGFEDGAATHVRVFVGLRERGTSRTIPTPTEADRVAVLAILAARGVRRLD